MNKPLDDTGQITPINVLPKIVYEFIIASKQASDASLLNEVISSVSECCHNFRSRLHFTQSETKAIFSICELSIVICLKELL